jgi:hypothetical protein
MSIIGYKKPSSFALIEMAFLGQTFKHAPQPKQFSPTFFIFLVDIIL